MPSGGRSEAQGRNSVLCPREYYETVSMGNQMYIAQAAVMTKRNSFDVHSSYKTSNCFFYVSYHKRLLYSIQNRGMSANDTV